MFGVNIQSSFNILFTLICLTECGRDHYGLGCKKACSERGCNGNSSCNRHNGSCDTGCLTGWVGDDCGRGILDVLLETYLLVSAFD